jgi:hypothetical protein
LILLNEEEECDNGENFTDQLLPKKTETFVPMTRLSAAPWCFSLIDWRLFEWKNVIQLEQ